MTLAELLPRMLFFSPLEKLGRFQQLAQVLFGQSLQALLQTFLDAAALQDSADSGYVLSLYSR
jgi:hypothetical protein